jgi:hypothetical protein
LYISSALLERREEVVEVVPRSEDVLLYVVFLGQVDSELEIVPVLRYEKPAPALGTVVLDHHGAVDVLGFVDELRHLHAGGGEPLPLLHAVGFPIQHRAVAEVWQVEVREPLRSEVLDERTRGNYDDALVQQFRRPVDYLVVRSDREELVRLRQRECIVELRRLADADAERLETFGARPVENL